ncbi:apelin receptor early endogenous ligand [Epinephelus fuscoguttatus]|uniref:apelin receptor early endogenous ligand n=1 Tax=Epinephelus lanceolatus TaxID=310571 RepID=UPI001447938C|nr:apelin receptor early endogenous ligand [Epinephelus lanceolatus]XP_049427220.1 apelin receptor early endogenous ligand [Epinephelus fuscoguttatus]
MRIFNLLYLLLLLVAVLVPAYSIRPDFLNLRRKYHRHHCPHRRCLPLHSRVPFP